MKRESRVVLAWLLRAVSWAGVALVVLSCTCLSYGTWVSPLDCSTTLELVNQTTEPLWLTPVGRDPIGRLVPLPIQTADTPRGFYSTRLGDFHVEPDSALVVRYNPDSIGPQVLVTRDARGGLQQMELNFFDARFVRTPGALSPMNPTLRATYHDVLRAGEDVSRRFRACAFRTGGLLLAALTAFALSRWLRPA